jgi:hypothetical protein
MSYDVISQTAAEVAELWNAPAVAMDPYLLKTRQIGLLRVISIYDKRGDSLQQLRLLYMNGPALALWEGDGQDGKCHWSDKTSTGKAPHWPSEFLSPNR